MTNFQRLEDCCAGNLIMRLWYHIPKEDYIRESRLPAIRGLIMYLKLEPRFIPRCYVM